MFTIFRSGDGGMTWAPVTNNFDPRTGDFHPTESSSHPDQHALAFAPDDPPTIYIGNAGGISGSEDGGVTLASPYALAQGAAPGTHAGGVSAAARAFNPAGFDAGPVDGVEYDPVFL